MCLQLINLKNIFLFKSLSNFEKCEAIYKKCYENQQTNVTLVYINFMRFMRRTKGIKAARDVFKLGREDKQTTYHLYIAAAEMEFLCTKVFSSQIFFRPRKNISFNFRIKQ